MRKIVGTFCILLVGVTAVVAYRSWKSSRHQPPIPAGKMRIEVNKSSRQLLLFSDDRLVRTYPVGLGKNPLDKVKEGDNATPEGEFYVFTKNPESKYYLSLGLSYPNAEDAQRGLSTGLINQYQYQQIVQAIQKGGKPPQDTALGGEIYIHGNGSWRDWTWGCVALDDPDMKELYDAVQPGTKVIIRH
jgi:murein L,D-transpeptidase YafK